VKIHGATVHFVTASLDNGPIIAQAAVPVLAGDTEESLAARVLAQEHRIYPQAARWLAEGRVEFPVNGVVQSPGSGVASDFLLSPRVTP
jgi:phosphoribosylglycinamide formyltransferase-1